MFETLVLSSPETPAENDACCSSGVVGSMVGTIVGGTTAGTLESELGCAKVVTVKVGGSAELWGGGPSCDSFPSATPEVGISIAGLCMLGVG